jgi:hypothetical protein
MQRTRRRRGSLAVTVDADDSLTAGEQQAISHGKQARSCRRKNRDHHVSLADRSGS